MHGPIDPVISGIAQIANKDDERIVHPLDLLEAAAREALADAGLTVAELGGVFATPMSAFRTESTSRLVAERIGAPDGLRDDSRYSGAAPQRLLAAACRAVADGTIGAALIVGGIADASVRRARLRGIEPPAPPTSVWSQGSDGIDDEMLRRRDYRMGHLPEAAAGAAMPSAYFALVESSLAGGADPTAHRERLGRLLAPFTAAAARRPAVAWFPHERTPADIAAVSDGNRLIAEPYTKLMCSFPTVDLAAAVVITAAGRGSGRAVRPLSLTAAREPHSPSRRELLHRAPALERAVGHAIKLANIGADDIDRFDLYSCFPAAVQMASRAFGLTDDDPRPRSVAGGLAYFGGPGASYSLHGVVSMVEELRANPGTVGAVVGLGGMVDDFSVGIYRTEGDGFASVDLGTVEESTVEIAAQHHGRALVDAMTVLHDRDEGPVAAPVIARLPDGARIGAIAADPALPALLSGTSLVGREVTLTSRDGTAVYTPD